jgi:hypothetical protein
MHLFGRYTRTAVIATATVTLTFCGGGDKGAPPTQPAQPTPTPVATGPTPDPPLSATCERLPLGSSKYTCRDDSPTFLDEVSDAIDTLQRQHPEYFDGDKVRNAGAYYVGIIKLLDQKNICAGFDGEELAVKNTSEFNDQYKLMTSWGQIRKFYIGTCYPAVFPLNRANPAPSPTGCSLPPSYEITCGSTDARYRDEVESAIDQLIAQRPELFDPDSHAPGTDWPKVKDLQAYQLGVIEVLAKQGFCGRFDGEEIQIKRTNEFTEHYDVNFADAYVRRGAGIYRGSCYPAAF